MTIIQEKNNWSKLRHAVEKHGSIENFLETLSLEELQSLQYNWELLARPQQLPPSWKWRNWGIITGRGWGKTRTGAEFCIRKAIDMPGSHGAIIGPTWKSVVGVMVKGKSGILDMSDPVMRPRFNEKHGKLFFPDRKIQTDLLTKWVRGAEAECFTAEEADRLRGPEHSWAWCDEMAGWKNPRYVWDVLQMGLREKQDQDTNIQICITTTPKPIPILHEILEHPRTHVTKGAMHDNAENLETGMIEYLESNYARGSIMYEQEIMGKVMREYPDAMWRYDYILRADTYPKDLKIVVGVDPAVSAEESSNETGIVVCGYDEKKENGYVLNDSSGIYTPEQWAKIAVGLYADYHAYAMIAEKNNGGDLVKSNIQQVDKNVNIKLVSASQNKEARAEPIVTRYQQGRVFHVGVFESLETQMTTWRKGTKGLNNKRESPDRVDALVWALSEFFGVSEINIECLGVFHNVY